MEKMLIFNIGLLATPHGSTARRGKEQGQIELTRDAWVLIEDGKIAATGAGKATGKFCLASTHPSPLSANRATAELPAFMGSRPFSAANRLLEQHGSTPVNWTCLG